MLWVAIHFPGLPPNCLEPLAAWACQFTPKVALAPGDALLAEVQGSVRYFGGLQRFLETLRAGLDELGFAAVCATAATSRAALWRAPGGGGKGPGGLPPRGPRLARRFPASLAPP